MKKIIALALALIMALSMASVAFAAAPCGEVVGEGLTCEVDLGTATEHLLPGEKYALIQDFEKDYKISGDWKVGGALVASISFDKKAAPEDFDPAHTLEVTAPDKIATTQGEKETGIWVMELKENYTISDAKRLEGKLVFTGKDAEGEKVTEKVAFNAIVSNHVATVQGEEEVEDVVTYEAANNTIYVCEEDWAGYVAFNDGRLLSATLDMESEEKVFMYNDEKMIEALAEKFPEAEIECYNFGAVRTLQNEADLTLQADYADQYYVYTYNKGVLEAQDYTWNSVDGVYEWSSKTLGSYVISDVELVAAEEETKNPDTGANDVVGVAAALAVVSLVAGAAVSLKK